ncbi:MAG: hypothetical protein L3K03_06270 [Thermoplasmata archaeon]|nr:hypothetical protein [Thermoplasmata archaeon]
MTALLTLLEEFFVNPTVGLPVVLIAGGLAVWTFASAPRVSPRRIGWDPAYPTNDRDPVSRTYWAIDHGEYSHVLSETYDRLNVALLDKTGVPLDQVPRSRRAAAQKKIPRAQELRALRGGIDRLYVWSLSLERGTWLRWDFWRTPEASRRVFTAEFARLLQRIGAQLKLLEGST